MWHHTCSTDPVWILSEVDQDKNIVRQIERYWDDRIVKRSAHEEKVVSLSDIEFDEDEISDEEGEFSNFELCRAEFDRIWKS